VSRARLAWGAAALLVGVAVLGSLRLRTRSKVPASPTVASPAVPPTGALALSPLTVRSALDARLAAAQATVEHARDEVKPWVALARLYVRKVRETSDPSWYAQARDASDRALELDATSQAALATRGVVLLNDHRFEDAASLARELITRAPDDWVALGLLGDAQVELGHYDDAARSYQRMVDLHPGQNAYSRASWMRWLTGDPAGAIALMKLAVAAGSPRDVEGWAWCTSQLGQAHLMVGELGEARRQFELALARLPGFQPALLGRGRVLAAAGRLDEAIASLRAATAASPTVEALWALSDALSEAGHTREAAEVDDQILRVGERSDPRTFAQYLATRGRDPERALRLAEHERALRPDIFSDDAFAWALFANGRFADALGASEHALRLGTRDARLLYHAGAIARAAGEPRLALERLRAALATGAPLDGGASQRARAWVEALAR
jgi:tetratricopeptide (TPR) repeat protein